MKSHVPPKKLEFAAKAPVVSHRTQRTPGHNLVLLRTSQKVPMESPPSQDSSTTTIDVNAPFRKKSTAILRAI